MTGLRQASVWPCFPVKIGAAKADARARLLHHKQMDAKRLDQTPKRVLIAMDGSEYSAHAFRWYLQNVHREGNRVIAVYVPEHDRSHPQRGMERCLKWDVEQNRNRLIYARINELILRAEVDGKVIKKCGNPKDVVLKVAKQQEVDFIVTGSKGLNTLKRTMIGSVSDHVLHHARIPVLIVHFHDQREMTAV